MIFENTCNCIFEDDVLEAAIIQECNSRGIGSEARKRHDVTKEQVLRLKESGFTIPEIAKKLNCGYNTVCRRLGMNDY